MVEILKGIDTDGLKIHKAVSGKAGLTDYAKNKVSELEDCDQHGSLSFVYEFCL